MSEGPHGADAPAPPEGTRRVTRKVEPADAGARLDVWVTRAARLTSRAAAQRLIAQGNVLVDGAPATKHHIVHARETVEVNVPPPEPSGVEPQDIPIDVRYEDEHLIVLSKPAGLVVHPAHGHADGTLVNALLAHTDDLAGIGGVERPGIVHRLDRDTSGLMLVAKNDRAHASLAAQLKDRTLVREYLALVHGAPPSDEGIIDAPIARSPRDRKKMGVVHGGRAARTRFTVEQRLGDFTLLRLKLETGRTHQIRVHLAYLGVPIAGDPVYGGKGDRASLGLERQFLHAAHLEFDHPATGERMSFDDELPEELEKVLEGLTG